MFFLLGAMLWNAYLGWQWKRTRTIPEELKELRKQQPPKDEQGNRPPSKVDGRIAALEEVSAYAFVLCPIKLSNNGYGMALTVACAVQQRKLMSKKEYKGVHHNWGGLIMGLGTATAVAGPINTYLRAGMSSCD